MVQVDGLEPTFPLLKVKYPNPVRRYLRVFLFMRSLHQFFRRVN